MAEKKNALDNSKLTLSALCPTEKNKYSTLKWEVFRNNPRIVVRTNDTSLTNQENNWGKIEAAMDAPGFYVFLQFLKDAYEASSEIKNKIESYNYEYSSGQRSEDIRHIADTVIGKDKEGCIFIAVVSKKDNWPVIKFVFGPSDNRWLKYCHGDGTPYTKAEISVIYAKVYYRLLSHIIPQILVTEYVEPPPYDAGKRQSGYKSNYQKQDSDVELTDLPF